MSPGTIYYFSYLCTYHASLVSFVTQYSLAITLNIVLSHRSLGQFLPLKSLTAIYAATFWRWVVGKEREIVTPIRFLLFMSFG